MPQCINLIDFPTNSQTHSEDSTNGCGSRGSSRRLHSHFAFALLAMHLQTHFLNTVAGSAQRNEKLRRCFA